MNNPNKYVWRAQGEKILSKIQKARDAQAQLLQSISAP
jgi:hypothetical protein